MKTKFEFLVYSFLIFTSLYSCKESGNTSKVNQDEFKNHRPYFTKVIVNDENIPQEDKIFLKAEPFVYFETPKELEDWITQKKSPVVMQGLSELPIVTGVQGWRITYQTKDLQGERTNASGLLLIPNDLDYKQPHALVNVLHATITSNYDAPGQFPKEGLWEAGSGLVVAAPDYLGFGASNHIFHPFLIEKGYQESLADFISAIYWLANNKLNLNLDKGLFIKGHSEGGYATLALQKYLEEIDPSGEKYNLKAAASSSGPYSTFGASQYILEQDELPSSVLPPYLIISYREHYKELEETLSDEICFKNPIIRGKNWKHWYSGKYEIEYLTNFIPSQKTELFKPAIAKDLLNNLQNFNLNSPIVYKLIENDFLAYSSLHNNNKLLFKSKTLFTGCTNDKVVPSMVLDNLVNMNFDKNSPIEVKLYGEKDMEFKITPEISAHENCPSIYKSTLWLKELI